MSIQSLKIIKEICTKHELEDTVYIWIPKENKNQTIV